MLLGGGAVFRVFVTIAMQNGVHHLKVAHVPVRTAQTIAGVDVHVREASACQSAAGLDRVQSAWQPRLLCFRPFQCTVQVRR